MHVEDTDRIISLLKESRQRDKVYLPLEVEAGVRAACTFLNGCRMSKPILSFFIQQDAGYILYPIIKFRLKFSQYDSNRKKRNLVKTIHPGMGRTRVSVFNEMLEYFRIDSQEAFNLCRETESLLGHMPFEKFDQDVEGKLKEYTQSSRFNADYSALKRKRAEKLRARVEEEIRQKFHVLLSIGTDEDSICQIFRQAEVERVIKC